MYIASISPSFTLFSLLIFLKDAEITIKMIDRSKEPIFGLGISSLKLPYPTASLLCGLAPSSVQAVLSVSLPQTVPFIHCSAGELPYYGPTWFPLGPNSVKHLST